MKITKGDNSVLTQELIKRKRYIVVNTKTVKIAELLKLINKERLI